MNLNQSLDLTVVCVPDKKSSQCSAFFAEFPEAIAVGDNEDDAYKNLFNLFAAMLIDKRKSVLDHMSTSNYHSKPANLQFA